MTIAAGAAASVSTQSPPAAPQTPAAAKPDPNLGFTDTPMLPNLPWHVHDPARPHPKVVTPGATPGAPPSDAIVLFDGKDLSKWGHRVAGQPAAPLVDAKWTVRDGYFEVATPRAGDIFTREHFGDVQVHLEWAAPAVVTGTSQGRGNSGLKIMGLYEIQILDSVDNPTYADGQAAAVYGQWPPLVNAARKPGDWQTYDIVFEAPKFDGDKVVKPAFVTVIWNGVAVHVRKELLGTTFNRQLGKYTAHAPELPLMLQDHGNPVRYRNVWARRLGGYDQQ
jgi:3-keto-disaccharide hydrolase